VRSAVDSGAMARAPLPLSQLDESTWHLDCVGLLCPVPVIKAGRAVRVVPVGSFLIILADDPGAELDLQDWCSANRHEFVAQSRDGDVWTTHIRRMR
jgi:tRNA 2-thiouridine synthesizing protein A